MFDLLAIGAIPGAWPVVVLPLAALAFSTVATMVVVVLLVLVPPARPSARRVQRLEGTRAA